MPSAISNPPADLKRITIYTDGACEGNPGPGGWAAVLQYGEHKKEICGAELATTNNRMELTAALEALQALTEPCRIEFFTDSEYLKNGVTVWSKAWKRKNWKKAGKDIKNADLWKPIDAAASRHTIRWNWVRGHSGNAQNERCDQLAVAEIAKLRKKHTNAEIKAARARFIAEREQIEDSPALEL
jgi:ribonuclease HI